ncbi:MAG: WD40/YVTN/BNR-like repeat-containing protein [Chloroflexota bacterium]
MRSKMFLALLLLMFASACSASVQAPPSGTARSGTAPSTDSLTEPVEALASAASPAPAEVSGPVVENPAIVFLHMLDELNGWGLTTSAVVRTNDGGATWRKVSPQGEMGFGYSAGTTFLNATQAWVLVADAADPLGSGILYRSDDGGATWTPIQVPFGSADLAFLDDETGWAMVGLGVGAGSMGVAIYRTSDGGASWEQVYTNDPNLANATEGLPLGGIKNDLSPLDAQSAWVGGVVYAPEAFYFFKTSDGGRTWTEQPLPIPPGAQGADISIDAGPTFFSAQEGVLPVRFSGEASKTAFYVTRDGGQSWEFLASMPGAGAVDFVSPSEGVFWTGEQFFVTADGGASWTSVAPDILFGETFAGMDFVNANTGWVWTYDLTGQYGLYQTTDGGRTWLPLKK